MAPDVKDVIRKTGINRRGMQSYLGHLMATPQEVAAATVWTALRARQYAGGSDGQSLLFNGGFETALTGSAFDWHLDSDGAVEMATGTWISGGYGKLSWLRWEVASCAP